MSISPQYDTARSQIFFTNILITRRKPNQNRNYFNPLVSGPGWFEWWKIGVEILVGLSLYDIWGNFFETLEYIFGVSLACQQFQTNLKSKVSLPKNLFCDLKKNLFKDNK